MLPEYFDRLTNLIESGVPVVSVTLVDITGSAPQERGARMLVTPSGIAYGTVGGGKVEARAIREAERLLETGSAHLFAEWNLQTDIGMTCGGVVRFFFESFTKGRWSITLFGAGHVGQALSRILITLDCTVSVVDPRAEWLALLPDSPRLKRVQADDMADIVDGLHPESFVILLTMGHATDAPILARAIPRSFPFLGVIGSNTKRLRLIREMKEAGLRPEACGNFHCPVGLPVGRSTPSEIAVSITAQLLAVRDQISGQAQQEKQSRSQTPGRSQKSPAAASRNSGR